MRRLIVNADDFGLSQGASLGILRAHEEGIVTSATLMVNMPGAPEAFRIAKKTPTLGVGIHINLTGGRPLSDQVPSLTGQDGRFLKLPALGERASRDDLEREIGTQVEAFLAEGLTPTHLDSHHHVHRRVPAVEAIVALLSAKLGVPVRGTGGAPDFIHNFYGREQITVDRLLELLSGLRPGSTSEIMCHPAYLDPDILQGSSYALERVHELATLTAPAVRAAVEAHKITLVSYRNLLERR